MSNRRHRRGPDPHGQTVGASPGLLQRVRLFLKWFFAPRVAPTAWQRKPYLRNRNRRPGRFKR